MRSETMRPWGLTLAALALSGFLVSGSLTRAADEPGFFGRLFRGGGSGNAAEGAAAKGAAAKGANRPNPFDPSARPASRPNSSLTFGPGPSGPAPALIPPPANVPSFGAVPANPAAAVNPVMAGPATPAAAGGPVQRIRPQPRVSSAATEATPILTRVALGRSDDGKQFGMFLQVYSDGTVIDGEGTHRVGAEALKPLLQALQSPELFRLEGHCGAPPTDYIEQVFVTVYQNRLGTMRANSFSLSGNPQGCDPAVRQLHDAVEGLVGKLSTPATAPATATAPTAAGTPPLSLAPSLDGPSR